MPRLPVHVRFVPELSQSPASLVFPDAHGWLVPKIMSLATTIGPLTTFSPERSGTYQPCLPVRLTGVVVDVSTVTRSLTPMLRSAPVVSTFGSTNMKAPFVTPAASVLLANGCSRSPLPMTIASNVPVCVTTRSGPNMNLRPAVEFERPPTEAILWIDQLPVVVPDVSMRHRLPPMSAAYTRSMKPVW